MKEPHLNDILPSNCGNNMKGHTNKIIAHDAEGQILQNAFH